MKYTVITHFRWAGVSSLSLTIIGQALPGNGFLVTFHDDDMLPVFMRILFFDPLKVTVDLSGKFRRPRF
jgi:hypothetical protein